MKKILIKSKVINKLNFINVWEKMDEEKFEKSLIKVEVTDKESLVVYKLNYIATNKNITISGTHSLFGLSLKEIKSIIKEEYKIVYTDKFKDYYPSIIKELTNCGYTIIPLDDMFFVKLEENIEIEFDDIDLSVITVDIL